MNEQATKLLVAAKQTSIYLEMMFAICLGLRRGEVLGLQYGDIDFEKGTIHIQRQITVIKSSKEPPYGKNRMGHQHIKDGGERPTSLLAKTAFRGNKGKAAASKMR